MPRVENLTKFVYILPILWGIVLRCSIGLFPHSGKNKPVIYGDFEAQRHWMEITVNLPIKDWYFNTTDNDLNYWGLDYPPLTAYHSYFLGLISKSINANWTTLFISRGSESTELAALMRFFVLFIDIAIYLPAISYYYFKVYPFLSKKVIDLELILSGIFFPGIILIDYGHFQYNAASLGLFIVACIFFILDRDCIGSVFFCAALCYKQMELYHSLPIFFFLLGKCAKSTKPLKRLTQISLTVIFTFFLIFSPLLFSGSGFKIIFQIINRLFPVSRGVFEDKVSNFWCAISFAFKFKNWQPSTMLIICTICTLVSSLPACLIVFVNPRRKLNFLYATLIVSLAFFLFSYQVHEKSILISSASALLIIPFEQFWANFFLYVATLSMWPLFVKDNLIFAVFISCGIFLVFNAKQIIYASKVERALFLIFNVVFFTIVVVSHIVDPPLRFPFLYPLLISQWCCFAFLGHFIYFNWRILNKNERL